MVSNSFQYNDEQAISYFQHSGGLIWPEGSILSLKTINADRDLV